MTGTISFEVFQDISSCTFEETAGPWAKVELKCHGLCLTFIKDTHTHEIYNSDSPNEIRKKCVGLIPVTALFTMAHTIYNAAKVIMSCGTSFELLKNSVYYTSKALGAACYGIVYPYEGRKLFAMCERQINGHLQEADFDNGFYLARCFVPINHRLGDKSDDDMNILKIKRAVYREHGSNLSSYLPSLF